MIAAGDCAMNYTVLLFAYLKDKAGTREAVIDLPPGAAVADIKSCLAQAYPALKPTLANVIVTLNREYVKDEMLIPEGAEIALFPPVSGG
jgi:molybdopterin converting factor subunit 1